MNEAKMNALENGTAYFDLSTLTNFEWDSVFFVKGNESVPVMFHEIDQMLNERMSYVHWEDRIRGIDDTTFRWQTKNLRVNRDRFYFLTPNKELIEKEIKHRQNASNFHFSHCDKHSSLITWWRGNNFWLSKQEANFLILAEKFEREQDTLTQIWIKANCIDDR